MKNMDLFQKIYNQEKAPGTLRKFLYHAEEQFSGIDLCGKSVLEIGCGNGLISLWLALLKNTGKIVAIDEYEGIGEDRNNYNNFKKIIKENSLGIDLMKVDFWKNNFKPDSFDIVVANNALHHMIRTEKYIFNDTETRNQWVDLFSVIRRILKRDGILVLREVSRFNLWRFLPLRFRYMDWEIHPTKKEFAYVIRKAGFKNVDLRNVVNYKLRYLSNVLQNNPLYSFLVTPDFYLYLAAVDGFSKGKLMVNNKPTGQTITFIAPFAYPLLSEDRTGSTGGAERQFFLFGKELAKRGWRVSFITARPNYGSISSDHGFSVYHADFSYLGGSKLRMPYCWASLLSAMKHADTNYYIVKTPAHLLLPLVFFCRVFRKKLIFWAQTSHDSTQIRKGINYAGSRMQDWGLKLADIIVAQTKEQKSGFEANYGIHADVVPSICGNLNSQVLSKLDYSDKKPVDLLWVGNSSANKQQGVFFELARLLPDRTFAIAMNKSDDERFAEAAKEAGKLPNLTFLGAVPPVEMEQWFRKTKLFLNTSIREGFPNTFLQAWMNGVPVVSLNIDPDKIIEKNRLGYVVNKKESLVSHSDFNDLARDAAGYVETLLNDDVMRQEMGERAVLYVNENHSPSEVIPKLIDALTA